MKRRVRWIVAWIVLGAGVALLLAAAWVDAELRRPHAGWSGESVDIVLPQGLAAGQMLQRLHEAGVIRNPSVLRLWFAWNGGSESLQAGEYRFSSPASPLDVLRRLESGDVLLHRVTVPEGLVLEEIASRLVEGGFGPREELLAAFGDPTPVLVFDPEATDLEGYLFPETYSFPRETRATEIAAAMVRRFVEVVGPDFADRAAAAGLGLRQAVTLASLIEEETALPEERRRISRVFHNRLKRGMRLQCDPTVIYALQRANRPVQTLSRADLKFDSPWNTYVVRGLPPGPIANPGEASLMAAVEPAEGRELYFVAAPEGGHHFSEDLAGHRRAVARWRAYSRSSR